MARVESRVSLLVAMVQSAVTFAGSKHLSVLSMRALTATALSLTGISLSLMNAHTPSVSLLLHAMLPRIVPKSCESMRVRSAASSLRMLLHSPEGSPLVT